jgi:hypothetical protein
MKTHRDKVGLVHGIVAGMLVNLNWEIVVYAVTQNTELSIIMDQTGRHGTEAARKW